MVRIVLAVALTAVAQFVWGFTYFGISPIMDQMTSRAPDEAAVLDALARTLPASGTYFLPGCPNKTATEDERKAKEALMAAGPIVQIHYRKAGFDMADMPVVMGKGFGLSVISSLVAALMLSAVVASLRTYGARVAFVTGIGVLLALGSRVSDGVWFDHHWAYVVGQALFAVTVWLISGLVMGAIIRPAKEQEQTQTTARPSLAA